MSNVTEGQNESVGLKFRRLLSEGFLVHPEAYTHTHTHSWATKHPTVIFKGHKDVRLHSTGLVQAFLQKVFKCDKCVCVRDRGADISSQCLTSHNDHQPVALPLCNL